MSHISRAFHEQCFKRFVSSFSALFAQILLRVHQQQVVAPLYYRRVTYLALVLLLLLILLLPRYFVSTRNLLFRLQLKHAIFVLLHFSSALDVKFRLLRDGHIAASECARLWYDGSDPAVSQSDESHDRQYARRWHRRTHGGDEWRRQGSNGGHGRTPGSNGRWARAPGRHAATGPRGATAPATDGRTWYPRL